MRLTTFTDLSLRIVMRLAVAGEETLTTRSVAGMLAVPYTHAAKAVARLSEMGLVEAEAQLAAGAPYVLYVYAEEPTPEYYLPAFGEPVAAHAVAMLLKRETAS